MSDDLVKRLEFGSTTTMGAHRLNLEAATRIRELEAELAALREARGVQGQTLKERVADIEQQVRDVTDYLCSRGDTMPLRAQVEAQARRFIHALAQRGWSILPTAALEPAPVTAGEAAKVLIEEWRHGEGPLGDLVCYSMDEDGVMRPDIDGRWTEFPKIEAALFRASLTDAGEAG